MVGGQMTLSERAGAKAPKQRRRHIFVTWWCGGVGRVLLGCFWPLSCGLISKSQLFCRGTAHPALWFCHALSGMYCFDSPGNYQAHWSCLFVCDTFDSENGNILCLFSGTFCLLCYLFFKLCVCFCLPCS